MSKIALITGVTGQDGSYLSELLLSKLEYKHVFGIIRRSSKFDSNSRIDHLTSNPRFILKYGDITDSYSIVNILQHISTLKTDDTVLEIYHLAAQSHVQISFEIPEYTSQVDALGTLKILEAVRICGMIKNTRIYNATTSELYGKVVESPQTENTPFYPRSPYGVAKLYSYWIAKNYREAYDMFVCNGILFNHTSPRRGENFILRKITLGISKIHKGVETKLVLGNLDSQRDLGHAKDYVYGMWLMLQQDVPDDFVLSTGKMYKIRQLVEMAFKYINIDIEWKGNGLDEVGVDNKTGQVLVTIDKKYFRPAEVDELLGDCTKAKTVLNWQHHYEIHDIIKEMMEFDLRV